MGVFDLAYNIVMLFRITNDDASDTYLALTSLKLLITFGMMIAAWRLKERCLPFAGPSIMLHKIIAFFLVLQSEAEEGADKNFDKKMYANSG